MKKVLLVIFCLLLVVGCGKKKEEEAKPYMVTLDINPTIELEVKGDVAQRINPEGNDALELINRDFEGKKLDEVFAEIIKNANEKGYIDDDVLFVIVGYDFGEDSNSGDRKMADDYLKEACEKSKIQFNIIVPEITEEAKHEAQGYGVTPAKAQVILDTMKDNEALHFDDLKDKSARELVKMKETGLYCDNGYTLNGDKCERRIKDEAAKQGKTCPEGYEEIKGKCYKIGPSNHEPYCKKGSELKDGKCVSIEEVAASAKCNSGTYNSKTKKCEESTYASDGTKSCNKTGDPGDQMMSNGRCSRGKWAHDDNTCEGNDVFIADKSGGPNAGWCYNPTGDYDAIVSCPSGQTAKDGKCYKVTTSDPTYTCDKGELSGDKCKVETAKEPTLKVTCDKGLTSYQDRACIDYKDIGEYITGLTCSGGARLEGDRCVYYESVAAKAK